MIDTLMSMLFIRPVQVEGAMGAIKAASTAMKTKKMKAGPQLNGNFRILKWRYCTTQGHIWWEYSLA